MLQKIFQVQVELEIQAVTCPGVWLCPNGKVSIQWHMLGSSVQTSNVEPIFPLIFQEKFVFYKTFLSIQKLLDLQRKLNKECVYAELIQWQDCEIGNVLASFQTTISDLLFPGKKDGSVGVDIDLLMEPMKHFPGILAPKIEVSTKMIIEDKICSNDDLRHSYVINSQVLPSKHLDKNTEILRQKRVCHTSKYHRAKDCSKNYQYIKRPPFLVRKVDDNLINRNYGMSNECSRFDDQIQQVQSNESLRKSVSCVERANNCDCFHDHQKDCAVCSKYKKYFDTQQTTIKSKKYSAPCSCTNFENKISNYPNLNKPSLSEKIHNRLSKVLDYVNVETPHGSCIETCRRRCECNSLANENLTMTSFCRFCKNLYEKGREKCENYIPCY